MVKLSKKGEGGLLEGLFAYYKYLYTKPKTVKKKDVMERLVGQLVTGVRMKK